MTIKRGPLQAGEKVQLTDRKQNMVTIQLVPGTSTQTEHGYIRHDDVIGLTEGSIITTVSASKISPEDAKLTEREKAQEKIKPWKGTRRIGGWNYCVMRPRLTDYVLSMPRGAQIMYPKDIAQVIQLGDIRSGMRVLESGGGSGAMGINLLEAVGQEGHLITIELRPEFARICKANAAVFYGFMPSWWTMLTGNFDERARELEPNSIDRIVLDMLDPWNRLSEAHRVIAPGGVLIAYITTTTQLSRLVEALRESDQWTEPHIEETLERTWKADGLAVRPNHQMIGHTGFLVVTRAMADGFAALHKKDRPTKDTHTDIDEMDELELREMSDRKIRKVLRDLTSQLRELDMDLPETE